MASIHQRSMMGRRVLLLVCMCLLFAACDSSGTATPTSTQPAAFHTTVKTADQRFAIQFSMTPNRLGLNTFTVQVQDAGDGTSASGLQARLTTTMLDMDMGTDQVAMQPAGPGRYSAQGTLSMAGHWGIRILLRTPDAQLHQATVEVNVAS